ncbi:hypothetical protein RD792_010256 [Penstemon davidsonii]|uniref:Ubiquitin-like domain-containing protein n=1 Tax=Penstemon davidsonii TaxID=160366 RepID=A0ABR0D1C8_9LAMI|nr:hypothetical protein RD792_010256 [Penstemon davidsonii]
MASHTPTEKENNEKLIKVSVKFAGRSIPVEIGAVSTIKDLKSILQTLTNVLPRGQKLIFKGKVVSDESTMAASGITDGSKIMLMASQGLHQGDGPVKKEGVALPSMRRLADVTRDKKGKTEGSVTKSHLERWKATGVIGLSECGLTTIPEEVWTCGTYARVLDLSHNSLHDVPAAISRISSVQKLHLSGNDLLDKSMSWEGITSLKSLVVLSLNLNNLSELPSSLGSLTCLKQLHVANNKLTCLPTEIGLLTELQVLKAQNNRLSIIPPTIGGCVSLVEVDLSCNLLAELPETLGSLKDLKFEGWESFDERRRLKHQKQLEFRVTGSAEFDEGADKNWIVRGPFQEFCVATG